MFAVKLSLTSVLGLIVLILFKNVSCFECSLCHFFDIYIIPLLNRYLNTYKKYQDLLNNKAETEVMMFLQDEPVLLSLSEVGLRANI
jgi:hypothetical protein